MNKRNLYAYCFSVYICLYFFIRLWYSIYKKLYEINGQKTMFGYDNINFKTVNLPKKQKYKNLCSKFGLKNLIK